MGAQGKFNSENHLDYRSKILAMEHQGEAALYPALVDLDSQKSPKRKIFRCVFLR